MAVKRNPDRQPSHPGAILRDVVLPEAEMPVMQAAARLGVSRQTLHKLLAGKIGVSPAMALRLSRLFGSTPDFWLRLQFAHDLWAEQRAIGRELAAIKPLRKAA